MKVTVSREVTPNGFYSMTISFRLVASVMVLSQTGLPVEAQPPAAHSTAFKQHVLSSWGAAADTVHSYQANFLVDTYRGGEGETLQLSSKSRVRIAFGPHGMLTSEERLTRAARPMEATLSLSNAHYSAVMDRAPRATEWLLSQYSGTPNVPLIDRRREALPWTKAVWDVSDFNLWDWLGDERVVVQKVEERAGSSVSRMFFTFDPTRPVAAGKEGNATLRSGWMDFDAGRYYCVTGYLITMTTAESTSEEEGTFEYGSAEGIPPLAKRVRSSPRIRNFKHGTFGVRSDVVAKVEYNTDTPDQEYYLTHYGLPEPVGVTPPRRFPRYAWWFAGAVAFGTLALVFRHFARRKRPAVTGSAA